MVVRIPLSEIQAATTIHFDFTNPATPGGAYGSHLSQNTGDTVFWAGHVNTSTMRVLSMKEGENRYSWRNVDPGSYPSTDFSSLCPDNNDWLNFVGTQFGAAAIIGAVQVGGGLCLAWTAARGGGFAHPHVQVLQIDTSTWKKTRQWQIWNADHTFAYPSLALNSADEVGIALAWVAAASSTPVSRSAFWATSSCGSPRLVTPPTPPTAVPDPTAGGVTTSPVAKPTPTAPCSPGLGTPCSRRPASGGHPVQPAQHPVRSTAPRWRARSYRLTQPWRAAGNRAPSDKIGHSGYHRATAPHEARREGGLAVPGRAAW